MVETSKDTPPVETPPTPETPFTDQPETDAQKITRLEAEKTELHGRAQRAEAKLKDPPPPETPPAPETPVATPPTPEAPKELLDGRQYSGLLHDGYNKEEITYIESMMKANGTSLEDTLKNEFVVGTIKQMKGSKQTEEAIPTPSPHQGPPPIGDKPFKDMTEAEREQNYSPQAWLARQKKNL